MNLRPFHVLRMSSSRMFRVRLRLRYKCKHKHKRRRRRRSRLKGKDKGGSGIRRIIGGCSLLIVIDFLHLI